LNVIKELRKQKKISQAKLAENIHVTQATVSRWETGEMLPTLDILTELSKYFSVSIDYILGNEQKNKPIISEDDELTNENIELFKKLPDDKKQQALDYLRYLVEHQGKE